jgi:hypothetical protein
MKHLILTLALFASPALADKLADAQWVLSHQDRYTAAQINWAKAYVAANAPTPAPTITTKAISGQTALLNALSGSKGGETFLLADGNYSINLADRDYKGVTLKGGRGARIGSYAKLTRVSNLSFAGLTIRCSAAMPAGGYCFKLDGTKNITFNYVAVAGVDGTGFAFYAAGAVNTGLKILKPDIGYTLYGVVMYGGADTLIEGGDFHHLGSDGISISGNRDTIVRSNIFRDAKPRPTQHPDVFQMVGTCTNTLFEYNDASGMWQGGGSYTKPQINVIYRRNRFAVGYSNVIYLAAGSTGAVLENSLKTVGQYKPLIRLFDSGVKRIGNTLDGKPY